MQVVIERHGDDQVVIQTPSDLRDRDRIKTIPGARYVIKDYAWYAPLTWATCKAARGVFGNDLTIGPKLTEWATEYATRFIAPAVELRAAWDAEGDEDLYPFQRAGVRFLATVERALLCDEMGTGKTPQTIRTLKALHDRGENVFPIFVTSPKNMTITWRKEFERWWPGVDAVVVKGSAAERRKIIAGDHQVFITNFESIRSHSRLAPYGSVRLKRCIVCDPTLPDTPANKQASCEICKKEYNEITWRSIVVDEAHRMKDPKAKQTRSIWALRTDETRFRFALTGTAIADAPHDLWSSLHFIEPESFPSRNRYIDRYCSTSFNLFGGMTITGLSPDTKEEFFQIIDPKMRRMPKDAVLPFLPKKTYSERYVEMTAKQARAYKQMEEGLISIIGNDDTNVAVASNPLVQLTRMSQFASAFAEVNDDGEVILTEPSNKVDGLLELLTDMGDEPLVVMAQSRQLIELACNALEKHKISFSKIVGGQTADEREKEKDDFQEGKKRVILCTISAGGIGITLTRSAKLCFLQRSWSMIDNKQAEDRVHRIGSEIHDKVEIIDLISVNTLEERQRVVLAGKAERLEEIMRDRQTILRLLGKDAA